MGNTNFKAGSFDAKEIKGKLNQSAYWNVRLTAKNCKIQI